MAFAVLIVAKLDNCSAIYTHTPTVNTIVIHNNSIHLVAMAYNRRSIKNTMSECTHGITIRQFFLAKTMRNKISIFEVAFTEVLCTI